MNSDNLIGILLNGRYDVMEKIGTGGMATVYKAKDNLLNRFVAIKVLRDSLEGEESVVKNFIKEAQSCASLVHNNIVSVYDVGCDSDMNYMVMELVDGITLKEYIKEKGALPWQEACDYAIQISQGLNEAHSKNIIHRDIKPQNIIMTQDKTLKVTDFGIARAAASETTMVGSSAMGSVHYISPEQARGGYTDARSDIYSLGIVLYEMLTGKVPFNSENAVSVALMHLEKEPVNVKCVNIDIPADLAYITMKAISKEPALRYSDTAEMLDDLHAVLADEILPSKEKAELPEDFAPVDTVDEWDDFDSAADEGDTKKIDTEAISEEIEKNKKKSKKEEAEKKNKKSKKKQKTKEEKKSDRFSSMLAILTAVVVVLIVAGTYFIMTASHEKAVPELAGLTIDGAQQMLESEGFKLAEEIEYSLSDDVSEGQVITQTPEAGKLVAKKSEVTIVVSIGSSGGNIAVPDVRNKVTDDAIEAIMDEGLTYVIIEENSDSVPSDHIVRQLPEAGTKVNKSDYITLFVSKGKAAAKAVAPENTKVVVPNVTGDNKDKASSKLQDNGLSLGVATRKASSSPEGTIISQSPQAGKSVEKGSFVTIVISSGNKESTSSVTSNEDEEDENEEDEPTKAPSKDLDDTDEEASGESTQKFTVKIPDAANSKVSVEIVANGRTVHNALHDKSEGSVTVDISGNGSVPVQAYIDGAKVLEKTLSFN